MTATPANEEASVSPRMVTLAASVSRPAAAKSGNKFQRARSAGASFLHAQVEEVG